MSDKDLYLMWVPGQVNAWGVFDAYSCPDPGAFPSWMYRQYTVPKDQRKQVFRKLMEVQQRLRIEKVVPEKGKEKEIFPELSDLLADPPLPE